MSDRDLTAEEARAEVEAFLGDGWDVAAYPFPYYDGGKDMPHVVARYKGAVLALESDAPTYRAAVDALKSAWRDAVRPWMEAAIEAKLDTADVDGYAPDERVIARVLKEDSHA